MNITDQFKWVKYLSKLNHKLRYTSLEWHIVLQNCTDGQFVTIKGLYDNAKKGDKGSALEINKMALQIIGRATKKLTYSNEKSIQCNP